MQPTLVIRDEQVQVLEAEVRRETKARVVAELRRAPPPDIALPAEDVLYRWLDGAERVIDAYAGNFRMDARRFLLLMLEFGPDFPKERWASDVLDDWSIPGISTLDVLMLTVAERRKTR